jgi:CheY-like chemotaxis protein
LQQILLNLIVNAAEAMAGQGRLRLTCVSNATAALAEIERQAPDLVILDHVLAGGEKGVEFIPRLKALAAHVPTIVVSGTLDLPSQLRALQGPRAAHYVLEKPVDLDELEKTVEIALTECGFAEMVSMRQSVDRVEGEAASLPEHQFTARLARQHRLLLQLRQTSARPNITHLAGAYGVARKTIIRDLQDLIRRGQLDPAVYPQSLANVSVVSGVVQLPLDFGFVFNGDERWIELWVRPSGVQKWTVPTPRQLLTSSPNALYAAAAGTARQVVSGNAVQSLNGLTDQVTLQAGANLTLATNGGTLTIAAAGGGVSGWSLVGNSGTAPPANFLGTLDDQPLELRVQAQRALRLERAYVGYGTSSAFEDTINVLAGYGGNQVEARGSHSETAGDPGPGGFELMSLRYDNCVPTIWSECDTAAFLEVHGTLSVGGRVYARSFSSGSDRIEAEAKAKDARLAALEQTVANLTALVGQLAGKDQGGAR